MHSFPSSFGKYVTRRDENEDNLGQDLEKDATKVGLAHVGNREASMSAVFRIARIAWEKFPDELKNFFEKLGERDTEIGDELKRLTTGNPVEPNKDTPEEIKPAAPDQGTGGEDEGQWD